MKDEIKEILDFLGNDKNYNCDCNDGSYYLELPYREAHELKDCITNLQILYDKATTDLVKESHARIKLQEENDYLKDIVSNTELSNEIKKADKWSKRELYKINYQRLKVNQRLIEENEEYKRLMSNIDMNSVDYVYNKDTKLYTFDRKNWYKINKKLDERFNCKQRIDKAIKILNEGLKELDTRDRNEVYSEEYLENALDVLKRKERNFTNEELEAEENYYKRHQVPFKENYKDYYKENDN